MIFTYPYPRPALTVDIVLIKDGYDGPEILLIQRNHPPFAGHWALPGGFVDENEPLEAAARRELFEETGLEPAELQQLGAFGDPGRDPRGWTVSVVFWTRIVGDVIPRAGDDAAAARWWPLNDLPPLAFDHANIVRQATGLDVQPQK
ncbi:MAG: NUDIX hydrolase [Anaerolineae bacterium]|nr:NUDIX hydrolase [Anaerolineae bacterium]